jgi:hypothetical protein
VIGLLTKEEVYVMAEDFNPVADYRRGMEANIAEWRDKIGFIEKSDAFSIEYKDYAIDQLKRLISNMETEIVGFDKLVSRSEK